MQSFIKLDEQSFILKKKEQIFVLKLKKLHDTTDDKVSKSVDNLQFQKLGKVFEVHVLTVTLYFLTFKF